MATYSGGMKRRLDLALALVHNPRALFLDEPTTGLDPVGRAKVWKEVRRLNADLGMTVFLTTQCLEEADELADRVGITDHGSSSPRAPPTSSSGRSAPTSWWRSSMVTTSSAAGRWSSWRGRARRRQRPGGDGRRDRRPGRGRPVALALAEAGGGLRVRELSLRTPAMDDVFLSVTGARIAHPDGDTDTARTVEEAR